MNKKIVLFAALGLSAVCAVSTLAIRNTKGIFTKAESTAYSITFDKNSTYEALGRFHSKSANGTDFVLYCVNGSYSEDGHIATLLNNGSGFKILNEFQNVTSINIDFEGTDSLNIFFDDANDGEYDNTRRSIATSGVECTPSDASYGEGCIIRCWNAGYNVQINSITVKYSC